jgi:hypothetical protein
MPLLKKNCKRWIKQRPSKVFDCSIVYFLALNIYIFSFSYYLRTLSGFAGQNIAFQQTQSLFTLTFVYFKKLSEQTSLFQVIDPVTGEKLGPGQVGEICVQTIFMTKGYLNRPDVIIYQYFVESALKIVK